MRMSYLLVRSAEDLRACEAAGGRGSQLVSSAQQQVAGRWVTSPLGAVGLSPAHCSDCWQHKDSGTVTFTAFQLATKPFNNHLSKDGWTQSINLSIEKQQLKKGTKKSKTTSELRAKKAFRKEKEYKEEKRKRFILLIFNRLWLQFHSRKYYSYLRFFRMYDCKDDQWVWKANALVFLCQLNRKMWEINGGMEDASIKNKHKSNTQQKWRIQSRSSLKCEAQLAGRLEGVSASVTCAITTREMWKCKFA